MISPRHQANVFEERRPHGAGSGCSQASVNAAPMCYSVQLQNPTRMVDLIQKPIISDTTLLKPSEIVGHVPERLAQQFGMSRELSYLVADATSDRSVELLKVALEARSGHYVIRVAHQA